MAGVQLGLFGKTSQELLAQTTGWIFEPFCNPSAIPKFQCLVLDDGQDPEWFEGDGQISHGEYWMPDIGEFPSVVVASSLLQILEADAPQKYYLSQKACAGILRRAERRGKQLPAVLEAILRLRARN